jgi:16S rRNA (guanine966-N2)-methyltransferase
VREVRVIAGTYRGRPLRAPSSTATRPTTDRVREAIFNVLGGLVDLAGSEVGDLFAGSGAFGIEALSRGAAKVVFVERDQAAMAAVRANLASIGIGRDRAPGRSGYPTPRETEDGPTEDGSIGGNENQDHDGRAQLVKGDVLTYLARPHRFDIAFCDPPYAFRGWAEVLDRLVADVAVLETDRPLDLPTGWETVKDKRYGSTLVTVVRHSPHRQEGTP